MSFFYVFYACMSSSVSFYCMVLPFSLNGDPLVAVSIQIPLEDLPSRHHHCML